MRLTPMVSLTKQPLAPVSSTGTGIIYLDRLRLLVKAGDGGNGSPLYGGAGGDGGDVVLQASTNLVTFRNIMAENPRMYFAASQGKQSSKGRPKELKVPPGITVIDVTESRVIGELNKKGDKLIVARGGKGGGPQNRFIGERIKPRLIQLDLKLLADIGFVGFPNAGKSTLLKALSRADPAISPRPFTTLKPQLGTVIFDDHEYQDSMLTIADLPGLIEGAHKNVGLGYEFLKHIERTLLLMFVIDIHGFQFLPTDPYRTAFETILLLNKEIELYNPDLLLKPAILCLNKTDSDPSGQKTRALIEQIQEAESLVYSLPAELRPQRLLKFDGIFPICAKDRTSINELKLKLRSVVDYCQQLRLEERETRPDLALNSAEIFQ